MTDGCVNMLTGRGKDILIHRHSHTATEVKNDTLARTVITLRKHFKDMPLLITKKNK